MESLVCSLLSHYIYEIFNKAKVYANVSKENMQCLFTWNSTLVSLLFLEGESQKNEPEMILFYPKSPGGLKEKSLNSYLSAGAAWPCSEPLMGKFSQSRKIAAQEYFQVNIHTLFHLRMWHTIPDPILRLLEPKNIVNTLQLIKSSITLITLRSLSSFSRLIILSVFFP